TRFLNQDTAFFVGADKIAKILKAPVIYVAMRREGPGRYSVELTLLAEPPYDRDSGPEIVERYPRRREQDVRRTPPACRPWPRPLPPGTRGRVSSSATRAGWSRRFAPAPPIGSGSTASGST